MNPDPADLRQPLLLAPDNFTPRSRTPWAGTEIHARYKKLVSKEEWIGESWEISCDPAFPSRVAEGSPFLGQTLQQVISEHPARAISPELAKKYGADASCPILIKLVNAAAPLSLQVHPADDDPMLAPDECGKPESWLILHAEPGAGIYLGLKRAMTRESMRESLRAGKFSGDDLHFVPVRENDYFEVSPGVVHAIGPGITMLEPQRIRSGRSGKTYRVWDWNRKYDTLGHEDPVAGKPRELHVEQALRLFDPTVQHGPGFAASVMRHGTRTHPAHGTSVLTFPANENYQVHRVQMLTGAACRLEVAGGQGFATLTVLDGAITAGGIRIPAGHSAFVPWAALPLNLDASTDAPMGADFALVSHAALNLRFVLSRRAGPC